MNGGYIVRHKTTGALLGVPGRRADGSATVYRVAFWGSRRQAMDALQRRCRDGRITSPATEWEILQLERFGR